MGSTLSGELWYVFALSVIDAVILSWIVLRWYRHSVSRLMRAPADALVLAADDSAVSASMPGQTSVPPWIDVLDARPPRVNRRALPPGWRRLVAAYTIGTGVYASVMATATALEMWPVSPVAIVALVWANAWPLLPALAVLLHLDWSRIARLLGLFVMIGSAAVVLVTLAGQLLRGSFSAAIVTNVYWAYLQALLLATPPLALLAVAGWRRVRAVLAMTLAATLLFGITLLLFRRSIGYAFDVEFLRRLLLALAVVTSSQVAYYIVYMLIAVPLGWLVWRTLKWLADGFERKAFSDVQMIVDCWFAIVTLTAIATQLVLPYQVAGIAIGLAAFAGYRVSVYVILRVLPTVPRQSMEHGPARLLLLRVFGYQSRTESLFDHIAQTWRFHGPVQLIAGRDLAMQTVDPGNVLTFVGGRLEKQYVTTVDDGASRMRLVDLLRDPDGRFRINELYCLHNTWQPTLQALLTITDIVVMDLRGFSSQSRGCVFELEQLVTAIPVERIVLIADASTDMKVLEDTLGQAWTRAAAARSTRRAGPLAVIRVTRGSRRELDVVMSRLLASIGSEAMPVRV